ncbi:TniQ family protein [Nocardia sp. NPDC050793]|uniref:TniQ family protein n=1 Tax=Nocardia sp. NPDC050793 TaxID=3155159 RepID=UPI0033E65E4B
MRTLPIRVAPIEGEALDSWLFTIAHRTKTTWADLLTALAPAGPQPPEQMRTRGNCIVYLYPAETEAIAAATGITDTAVVDAMTLARFDGTALSINRDRRMVIHGFPWGRSRGSRYCPQCLIDSGGRWQLQWRLGWVFACLTHHCLLVDDCPHCLQVLQLKTVGGMAIPRPSHCTRPAPGATGIAAPRCDGALAIAHTVHLPANHPALRAQQVILDVITSGTGSFGVYADRPLPARTVLSDVRAVARRVLDYASVEHLSACLPADLVAVYDSTGGEPQQTRMTGLASPARAVTTAIGVTAALDALTAPDIPTAGARLRWLISLSRTKHQAMNASSATGWGNGTSAILAAVQLSALVPFMDVSDVLRYRSHTAMPRHPQREDTSAIPDHRVPTLLWPQWALRFAVPTCGYSQIRRALPAAMLVVGSRRTLTAAIALTEARMLPSGVSRCLRLLRNSLQWNAVLTALTRLSDYLSAHDIPIDYRRRRSLDYRCLLSEARWLQICGHTATAPGTGHRLAVIRSWLFERISGLPAERSPFAEKKSWFDAQLSLLPRQLTPQLVTHLDLAAREFLDRHGAIDEPLTWHPPRQLLNGLALPGPDPDTVDVNELHRLIRVEQLSLTAAAEQLGARVEAARFVLENSPAPEALTTAQRRARGNIFGATAAALSQSELLTLYYDSHMSIKKIADAMGVSKQTITRLAAHYEVVLDPELRRDQHGINRDWLYEQYVTRRRALPDIARECGISTANLARWAKVHDIPMRPRGGPSQTANLNAAIAAESAADVLRPALAGIGGWRRLERFAAASRYPTLTLAAKALGASESGLVTQITRLEQELGGKLFVRAERNRPMKITPFGTEVIAAIEGTRDSAR